MGALEEPVAIDWSSAVVDEGTLAIELTGKGSGAWREHLEAILKRLDSRRAGRIKVKKDRIVVKGVEAESPEELRHLLESAVYQTNADLVTPPAEEDDAPGEPSDGGGLTEVYRAFAEPAAH